MKHTKRYLALLLTGVFAFANIGCISGAEEIYKGDFLKNGYTFYTAEGIAETDALSGSLGGLPLPGKTQISFDFSLLTAASASISLAACEYSSAAEAELLSLSFEAADGTAALYGVNMDGEKCLIADGLKQGRAYSLDIQLDLNKNTYNAVLYEGSKRNAVVSYKREIGIGKNAGSFGLSGINTDGGGNISLSSLKLLRERTAENIPVIDIDKKIVSVGAEISGNINTGDALDVYAAFRSEDGGRLEAVEKSACVYGGCDSYIEVLFPLSDAFKKNYNVSLYMLKGDGVYPLTRKGTAELSGGAVLPGDALIYTGFEADEQYIDRPNVTAGRLPAGWRAQGWSGPEAPFDIEIVSDGSGGGCVSLGAVDAGYMGIASSYIALPQNGVCVSFDVKCSEDYTANYPRAVMLYFDADNNFVGSGFTLLKNSASASWHREKLYISPADYPEGSAKLSVALCTSAAPGESGGRLYYDSVCIDDFVFNMECDGELSWYGCGDTVVYKPQYPLSDKITAVCGSVYNSDGALVDKISADAQSISEYGWQYTPSESGFYKVIFEAYTADNRVIYEYASYKAYYDSDTGDLIYIDKASHDFYVTRFENREYGSRNSLYGLSIGNYDGQYDLDIADKVGMSFVRLHAFSWKDIEPEDVTADNGKEYNWEKYDAIFDRIRNGGRGLDVIGNILYTPQWASPVKDESGTLVPKYARYAPEELSYITDFVKDLYARYGDAVDTWEIYNEPHLPGASVFWNDTAENYVKMLGAAYTALKSESNNSASVVMGGIGAKRYLSFYRQFLEKGGWQYTDKLVMHGYDLDPWNYLNINSQLGIEADKGVINTEGHMILFNGSSKDIYYSEKQLGLRMFNEFLRQIKYGVEQIAFFQPYDNSVQGEDLMILAEKTAFDDWSTVAAGLFRKKPYYQPRFAAGALNTLISLSGEKICYGDEYKTGNTNIVKLTSDGAPVYVIWCDSLEDMSADADISGIADGAEIIDWEGRSVQSAGFTPSANTMYFVKGLTEDAFSYLDSAQGEDVYSGGVVYSENEMNKKEGDKRFAALSDGQLFDHDTGEMIIDEAAAAWNELSLKSGTSLNGRFAVHTGADGLEYAVRTNSADGLEKALMVIGVDTFANGIQTDVVEITGAMSQSGSEVKKTVAPDIGGDRPSDDYSGKGEAVNGAKAFVTDDGESTYYCIYIPYTQLYPYFGQENGSVNFGLKFIGYSASGSETARYYWGDGYSPYSPWEFGTALPKDIQVFSGLVEVPVSAAPGEYVTAEILKDDKIVYFNHYTADDAGQCTVSTELSEDGRYVLKTYSVRGGYNTTEFIYTCN